MTKVNLDLNKTQRVQKDDTLESGMYFLDFTDTSLYVLARLDEGYLLINVKTGEHYGTLATDVNNPIDAFFGDERDFQYVTEVNINIVR